MIIEGLIILIPRPHPERKDENYFLKNLNLKNYDFKIGIRTSALPEEKKLAKADH